MITNKQYIIPQTTTVLLKPAAQLLVGSPMVPDGNVSNIPEGGITAD